MAEFGTYGVNHVSMLMADAEGSSSQQMVDQRAIMHPDQIRMHHASLENDQAPLVQVCV